MSREMVQTAAKLLAKAQSTTSDHEAIALVERSYSLLAKAISEYDQQHPSGSGGLRRRERRRLNDRRRRPRSEDAGPDAAVRRADPIARYRGTAEHTGYSWRRGIDVQL